MKSGFYIIAFPTVEWSLRHYFEQRKNNKIGRGDALFFNPLPDEADPPAIRT